MKSLLALTLALGLSLAAAQAQTATPEPTHAASPAPIAAPDAKPAGKEVREQCKTDAKAQGLKGPARKAAVDDCFAKARPDLARAQKCRKEGKDKGLADKELKTYVKQCKTSAQ
jgi:glucose/arabinose dehydrogenase